MPVRDPFEPPSPDKIVTRAIAAPLAHDSSTSPISATASRCSRWRRETPAPSVAVGGRFYRHAWCLRSERSGPVDAAALPSHLGRLGFAEYHAPPPDTLPPSVVPLVRTHTARRARRESCGPGWWTRTPPDSAVLFIKPVAGPDYRRYPMRPAGAYEYAATVPAAALREGPQDLVITVFRGGSAVTFPGGQRQKPSDWNFSSAESWTLDVVGPRTPLRLFDPATDIERLTFTRIGDAGRRGLFQVGMSGATGRPVFHLALPVDSSGFEPAGLHRLARDCRPGREPARKRSPARNAVRLRLRGLGPRQVLHVTLMEDDGTSWSSGAPGGQHLDRAVSRRSRAFAAGRGVLLPQGFPGEWNYWVGPADGRGDPDRPSPAGPSGAAAALAPA